MNKYVLAAALAFSFFAAQVRAQDARTIAAASAADTVDDECKQLYANGRLSSRTALNDCFNQRERPIWARYYPGSLPLFDEFARRRHELATMVDSGQISPDLFEKHIGDLEDWWLRYGMGRIPASQKTTRLNSESAETGRQLLGGLAAILGVATRHPAAGLNAGAAIMGEPPPVNTNQPIPARTQAYQGRIDGEYRGWDGDTIYKLMDGHIIQQADYHYHYHYAYSPEVVIYKVSNTGYKIHVEGDSDQDIGIRILK
jgi:hypothetical protein